MVTTPLICWFCLCVCVFVLGLGFFFIEKRQNQTTSLVASFLSTSQQQLLFYLTYDDLTDIMCVCGHNALTHEASPAYAYPSQFFYFFFFKHRVEFRFCPLSSKDQYCSKPIFVIKTLHTKQETFLSVACDIADVPVKHGI